MKARDRISWDPVLIVDDERFVLATTRAILEKAGYRVDVAANGDDALEHLRSNSFSLILLDLVMPGVNGLDLLSKIHRMYPMIPVIIFAADGHLATIEAATDKGAAGYLVKPTDPNVLLKKVEYCLRHSGD